MFFTPNNPPTSYCESPSPMREPDWPTATVATEPLPCDTRNVMNESIGRPRVDPDRGNSHDSFRVLIKRGWASKNPPCSESLRPKP